MYKMGKDRGIITHCTKYPHPNMHTYKYTDTDKQTHTCSTLARVALISAADDTDDDEEDDCW